MTLPAYPEYRESNVDWLDAAPCHWTDTRLRFVARLNPSKSEVADRDRGEEVSFLPMDAVGDDGSLRLEQTRPLEEVETGYTFFRDGDVAVAKITPCFENGKGAVMRGLVGGVGFGTTELIVARPLPGNSPDFLHWLFTSTPFRKRGEGSMYGAGGQKRVADDFVRDFRLALPPPDEQAAIAAFLDRETGKIDALVEAQQRLIGLLKEKRQAAISHAVTKGLDPAATMKDSGVEWLGEVPAHWTVAPMKRFTSLLSGFAFPSAGFSPDPSHTPLLRGINVGVGRMRWDDVVYWERTADDNLDAFMLLQGDLVLGMDRPWIGEGLRIATISEADLPCLLLQRVAAIRPTSRLESDYIPLLLEGEAFHHHCVPEMTGVSVPHISPGQVGEFVVALPPLSEQQAIIEHVRAVRKSADRLIEDALQTISLLHERRAALITAVVTGRVDVRQAAGVRPSADQAVARRLVGAAVLELVADTRASGRMTSAKRMYLAEAHAGVWELWGQPQRMAAGPFDGTLMSEVEAELARVGHIATSQPGGPNSQVHYRLTGARGALRDELDALLGDRSAAFDKMLADLGGLESKGVEAVATLYAVWNDMLIDGKTPTDDAVIEGVLNDWHAEKRDKFTKPDLHNYLGWMRRHGMTPTGRGPRTKSGALL